MADRKPTISKALGQFFGALWKGATADTDKPLPKELRKTPETQKQVVREDVEEETRASAGGSQKLTLRRTTIEEIEVTPKQGDESRG